MHDKVIIQIKEGSPQAIEIYEEEKLNSSQNNYKKMLSPMRVGSYPLINQSILKDELKI